MANDSPRKTTQFQPPHNAIELNRRDLLLTGSSLAAAAALPTAGLISVAQAQPAQTPAPGGGRKPNILVIFGDDIGQSNISAYTFGLLGYRTPNIDRIAREGMMFTDYYAEQSCTAGRSSFITMTGRFPIRSGTQSIPIGGGLEGLTRWEVTIAKALSSVGYVTGHFGKWHLGSEQGRLPTDQGFDEWYGIPRTTDEAFWPSEPAAKAAGVPFEHIMEGKKGEKSRNVAVYDLDQRRLIDAECARRAIDFMKRSVVAGKLFYAYIPFTLVHFPTLPNSKFAGKTGFGDFPDALAEMDAHVGEILDAVDSLGIRDNTLIVFTSDNGPETTWPWQGSSGPWRGYYFTHMEGSLRVPFIIRWPGRIAAGRISNEIVHEVDTFTTLARLPGVRRRSGSPARRYRKTARSTGGGEMAELEICVLRRGGPDRFPGRQVRQIRTGRR